MGEGMTTTTTTNNNLASYAPRVKCFMCGKELSRSSLASHLNRVHDYHGQRGGQGVVSQAQLPTSITPTTSTTSTLSGDVVLEENEPQELVIVETKRKGKVKRELEKSSKVKQDKVDKGKKSKDEGMDWGLVSLVLVGAVVLVIEYWYLTRNKKRDFGYY